MANLVKKPRGRHTTYECCVHVQHTWKPGQRQSGLRTCLMYKARRNVAEVPESPDGNNIQKATAVARSFPFPQITSEGS
ncbi:hypothetical protein LSAT2_001583 [Lamellibrachia satsuma]|nr:hypothetical protein LSAT2_001583 [Lamellibrachia satsuma]